MNGISDRLREAAAPGGWSKANQELLGLAASEIERLEAKVTHLNNVIKSQDSRYGQADASGSYNGTGSAY